MLVCLPNRKYRGNKGASQQKSVDWKAKQTTAAASTFLRFFFLFVLPIFSVYFPKFYIDENFVC